MAVTELKGFQRQCGYTDERRSAPCRAPCLKNSDRCQHHGGRILDTPSQLPTHYRGQTQPPAIRLNGKASDQQRLMELIRDPELSDLRAATAISQMVLEKMYFDPPDEVVDAVARGRARLAHDAAVPEHLRIEARHFMLAGFHDATRKHADIQVVLRKQLSADDLLQHLLFPLLQRYGENVGLLIRRFVPQALHHDAMEAFAQLQASFAIEAADTLQGASDKR